MHYVVFIKQVPDTAQVKIDPQTNTLIRTGVESICNPYDLVAAESAVQLSEKYGGKVTVISMGPPQAESALRDCLALGAHEAVLLSDRAFAGADTLATSYALSQTIKKIGETEPVSIVICGKQAIDGDTGQTGPGLATRLDFNQLTYISRIIGIDTVKNTITVKREVEGGSETIEADLPVLLTAELELATPRYATLPQMVKSLRQKITTWSAADINGQPEKMGLKGSPTAVKEIFTPPLRKGGPVFDATQKEEPVTEFVNAFFEKEPRLAEQILAKADEARA